MWRVLGSPNQIAIVEPGPGRGLFAQDVLAWSEKKFPDFFPALQYILIESSPALRHRMEATLAKHLESGKARLYSPQTSRSSGVILSAAALQAEGRISRQSAAVSGSALNPSQLNTQSREVTQPFMVADRFEMKWALAPEVPTILSANEFFDALPVEILSPQGSLRIDIRDNKFIETWVPASPQELEYLDHHSIHPEPGERLEAPLIAQQYMHRIADSITRGFLITIDYGYTREEQLAGRHRGTVKAIRQHSISNNPYEAPGEQDITADANAKAPNPIPIPDGHRRTQPIRRRLRRLPPPPGARESSPAAKASGNSRRHGRKLPRLSSKQGSREGKSRSADRPQLRPEDVKCDRKQRGSPPSASALKGRGF
jgi:hypothetical protein